MANDDLPLPTTVGGRSARRVEWVRLKTNGADAGRAGSSPQPRIQPRNQPRIQPAALIPPTARIPLILPLSSERTGPADHDHELLLIRDERARGGREEWQVERDRARVELVLKLGRLGLAEEELLGREEADAEVECKLAVGARKVLLLAGLPAVHATGRVAAKEARSAICSQGTHQGVRVNPAGPPSVRRSTPFNNRTDLDAAVVHRLKVGKAVNVGLAEVVVVAGQQRHERQARLIAERAHVGAHVRHAVSETARPRYVRGSLSFSLARARACNTCARNSSKRPRMERSFSPGPDRFLLSLRSVEMPFWLLNMTRR